MTFESFAKIRKPEWPGIATAGALICAATIVIAIARDPDFKLKDWQTMIAAFIALVGGIMAYRGAMAKLLGCSPLAYHRWTNKARLSFDHDARVLQLTCFKRSVDDNVSGKCLA